MAQYTEDLIDLPTPLLFESEFVNTENVNLRTHVVSSLIY